MFGQKQQQQHQLQYMHALGHMSCVTCPASHVLQVVGPGDEVQQLPDSGSIRIGSGLRTQEGFVVSQKCGVVRQTRNGKIWLEGRQKRCAVLSVV
jgi:exosome complex RNA-binding protein Rrp4